MQENRSLGIVVLNGDIVGNSSESISGASARVCKNGCWGFASMTAMDDPSIARTVKLATENARFLASGEKLRAAALPVSARSGTHNLSTERPRLAPKDLVDFVRSAVGAFSTFHAISPSDSRSEPVSE